MADREALARAGLIPSVSPTDKATPELRVGIPNMTFSDSIGRALGDLGKGYETLGHYQGQVGSALAHLGGAFEHAGDEIFARASAIKAVENHTAAVEAETKFRIEADKMTDGFMETNGNAASKGLDAHMKNLEDTRQKIKSTLPNPQALHAYEQQSLRILGNYVTKASGHSATQSKSALISAEEAKLKMALNDIYKDPDNPDNDRRKEEAIENFKNNVAPVAGISGPKLELKVQEMRSDFDKMQIGGIAKADPNRAWDLLEKRRGTMMAADIEMVEKAIEEGQLKTAPRFANNEINKDLTEKKTEEEREKEPDLRTRLQKADEWVDNYKGPIKNKEELRQRVHQAVGNGYNEEHRKRDDEYKRQATILESALTGARTPGVPPPTNMEMLRAQGDDVMAALAATGKKGRDAAYNAFQANINRGKIKYDPVDSLQRFEILKGMASTATDEFLDKVADVHDPKLQLNQRETEALVKLKSEVEKNPMGDPRTHKWRGWLMDAHGATMEALGVAGRRTTANAEEYDAFMSGMLATVEAFVEKNKHAPTREEFMRDIAPEVLKYKPGQFMFGFGTSEERPAWSTQTPVPEGWAERFKQRVMSIPGTKEPDEAAVRKAWVKFMYEQSFNPKTPEPEPGEKGGPKKLPSQSLRKQQPYVAGGGE